MRKLLIVDDDEIMREGIHSNVDWNANGVQVVGLAKNGLECLEMIKSELPGVILSDIRMPFLDGLQLTEAVHDLYPQIKMVLLTAYDEFQYARKALQLHVQEYVMKYEDNSEILKAVLRAFEECEKQGNDEETIRNGKALLHDRQICSLLAGQPADGMQKRLTEELRLTQGWFCSAVVKIDESVFESRSDRQLQIELTLEKIKAVCEQKPGEGMEPAYAVVFNHAVVLLFNPPGAEDAQLEQVKACLRRLQGNIQDQVAVAVTIGVGSIRGETEGIDTSYAEAVQALELRPFVPNLPSDGVVSIGDVRNVGNSHHDLLRQVVDYVGENYQREDLSLHDISKEVHVSSTYISTLFKKYKGINLNEYITGIRIKRAAELLSGTELKTYEISEQVGYPNPQYFSVIFKRSTGLSPTEYRRRCSGSRA